eukprot:PITA_24634
MPFGLKNAGATFQRAMSYDFHDIKHVIEAYLDDLVARSRKRIDHPSHLRMVFERCHFYKIRLNPKKCVFTITSGRLLGFIVSNEGIQVDPFKVEAIAQLPPPSSIRQLQNLQGKANFLRRFIANYVEITKGFMHLLQKGVPFVWDDFAQRLFDALKKALVSTPLLSPPDYGRDFLLYLAAAESTIGMVLVQEDDALTEHVIYYLSRGLIDLYSKDACSSSSFVSRCHRGPFTKWGIDFTTCNPPSAANHKYIIVAVDYFTKWAEAMPTYKNDSDTAALFLFNQVISRFGVPREIVIDHGSHFQNQLMSKLAFKLGFQQENSSPYYPRANGQVEAVNKTLKTILQWIIDKNQSNWHVMLYSALWAYRTSVKTATGFTPFQLVYGMESIFPIECEIPSLKLVVELLPETSSLKERLLHLEHLDEQHRDVATMNEAHKKRVKMQYDKSVRP